MDGKTHNLWLLNSSFFNLINNKVTVEPTAALVEIYDGYSIYVYVLSNGVKYIWLDVK